MTVGITLTFNKITNDLLNLPIQYLQILFQDGNEWLTPSLKELKTLDKTLKSKNIRTIIHINVRIHITNLTNINLARAQQEIEYAEILGSRYLVIHCGTKGRGNRKVPINWFRNRLNELISRTKIPILLENSASKKCYGSTLEELKEISNGLQIKGFVYDTMHHYAAGNDWLELWKILEDQTIKIIHVNNVPECVKFGSGQDKHESLDIGKFKDFDQLKRFDKIKILETPNQQKWYNELKMITTKITDFEIQNIQTGFKVWIAPTTINHVKIAGAIDTGAEITCISDKTIKKLKENGINIVYVANPNNIKLKQAAGEIGETEWIKIPITISGYTRTITIPVIKGQYRELLIGLDILRGEKYKNNGYTLDLMKGIMTGNNRHIKLTERDKYHIQEILVQELTQDDILYQIWKDGKYAQANILLRITKLTEKIDQLKNNEGLIDYLTIGRTRKKIKILEKERDLWEDALLELENKEITRKETERQQKEIKEFFNQKQKQIENNLRKELEEQKRKEKERQEHQEEQQQNNYQKTQQSSYNYYQPFDPRKSLYEEQLQEMRSRSRTPTRRKIRARSQTPIKKRSKSRLRDTSRRRSPTPIPKQRNRSRAKVYKSRSKTPTRKRSKSRSRQTRQLGIMTRTGKQVESPEYIPRRRFKLRTLSPSTPDTIIRSPGITPPRRTPPSVGKTPTPPQSRIPSIDQTIYSTPHRNQIPELRRQGSERTRTSSIDSSEKRRGISLTPEEYGRINKEYSPYETPSPFGSQPGTPIRSQSRSRQQSHDQSNRSRSQSRRSNTPNTNVFQAQSGLCINGIINGFKIQIGFSTIHKYNFMTKNTALRCNLIRNRRHDTQYLENTWMDHGYKETRDDINTDIRISEAEDNPYNRDLYITLDDIRIVNDENFFNRSQSLQDPRNRYFLIIGYDTIKDLRIRIDTINNRIKIPNPQYQAPLEKKDFTIKAKSWPDLSIPENRENIITNIISEKGNRIKLKNKK